MIHVKSTPISQDDRAFQFGDGCFTTMRCERGHVELLDDHLARLQHDCGKILLPFKRWSTLKATVEKVASEQTQRCVVKIVVSRGIGGRGYAPGPDTEPNAFIKVTGFPNHYDGWQVEGISVGVSPIRLAQQPLLAGLKHLNRLEQVFIKQALNQSDVQDVIVLDTQGNIIESSAANVFWFAEGSWHTPKLDAAGVAGVMRNHIIEVLRVSGLNVVQTVRG